MQLNVVKILKCRSTFVYVSTNKAVAKPKIETSFISVFRVFVMQQHELLVTAAAC